jgi:predicted RNA-binding Zn-ribbon protein involved in translation (DUF1610 family)
MGQYLTTEEFIRRAKRVHGEKFDYSKTNYVSQMTPVTFVCRECGKEITTTPANHLRGRGCRHCANIHKWDGRRITTEEFIRRAKEVHGNTYSYDNFVYLGSLTPSMVTCREHGDFPVKPNEHLRGCGCPRCGVERQRRAIRSMNHGVGYFDLENIGEMTPLKIKARSYWRAMLQRCYDPNFLESKPTYKGCRVCEEWLTLSNFLKWFEENYKEGYELDKDLLSGKENKVYSPNTCCFLPHELNGLICRCNGLRGMLPIGVRKAAKGKYKAELRKTMKKFTFGVFDTPQEAFAAYKREKEAYIKELAQKHYDAGNINERVYEAFINYKVEITD